MVTVGALTACDPASPAEDAEPGPPPAVAARWSTSSSTPSLALVQGEFTVAGGEKQVVQLRLDGARFLAIPQECLGSSTVNPRSMISGSVDTLDCWLPASEEGTRTIPFAGLVVSEPGGIVAGAVQVDGDATAELPALTVSSGPALPPSLLRLVSSPDFLNADIGDLRRGPGFWEKGASKNSINAAYRQMLDAVLDDWKSLDPAAVLVAGDLVNGHWGIDPARTGNFGPVKTMAQRRAALRRAAATYYPQWVERFAKHDLPVLPAIGDHEMGDDPWPIRKRRLAISFERAFARHLGHLPEQLTPRVSRPEGNRDRGAYAIRPHPDVQLITLATFDISPRRARNRLDHVQMQWVRKVLAKAERDDVPWIIVQGHVPILGPVRVRGSSGLMYEEGQDSPLWKLFVRRGVDLYLSGEAHDVTSWEADGVTQITHGGMFQFGLTNYLVLDINRDYAYLTLRDYDMGRPARLGGQRLWETRRPGLPSRVALQGEPFTIGTGILLPDGDLTRQSGLLKQYDP